MDKLIFSISENKIPFGIELRQKRRKNFSVKYGEQIKENLSYVEAATEFGLCLMHALNCDGKLD